MDRSTLDYYNRHSEDFINSTQMVNFIDIEDLFLTYIKPGGLILDLGCGAGRDTKYFLDKGYMVEAVDGSDEMCKAAAVYTGITIRKMLFQELHEGNRYDGIWACASLLHLQKSELPQMFCQIRDALKKDGIVYASFKYGEFEGLRNGRYFTDLTEKSLIPIMNQAGGFALIRQWITKDVREDRGGERWINIILKKAETI